MATKAENQGDFNSCWNRANADEPIFVLRAHDPLAANIVRRWAYSRGAARGYSDSAYLDALDCADAMDDWRRSHR